MAKLAEYSNVDGEKVLAFLCLGCGYDHSFRIASGIDTGKPVWDWNGALEKPTFSPSLMVNRGADSQCHLFVRDGQIQYLNDCWHDLRGQTVDMKEIDW